MILGKGLDMNVSVVIKTEKNAPIVQPSETQVQHEDMHTVVMTRYSTCKNARNPMHQYTRPTPKAAL